MKRFVLSLLLISLTVPQVGTGQFFPSTASRVRRGVGAPAAGECASASDVGKVWVRTDAAAANASLYVCSNTGVATYSWELISGGAAGGGATSNTFANCTAATPTNGIICKPTDSPYLMIGNGSSWLHWAFGFSMTPPVDTGYSNVNTDASFTVTTTQGGIRLFSSAGSGWQIRIKAYPTPPFTKVFHVLMHGYDNSSAGVIMRDSATGRVLPFYASFESAAKMLKVDHYTNPTTPSSNVAARFFDAGFVLHSFKIEDNNTNHIFSHSMTGGLTWHQVLSQSRTAFLANPDGIGITIARGSSTTVYGWFLGEE